MGKVKQHKAINNRTDFFYYAFRSILLISVPLVIISALVLSLSHSSATSSGTDNVQLVLSTSCTVNAVVTAEHTVSLNGGQLDNNVGNTKLSAYCNDNNGYGIYAVGSSGDVDGNTELINTVNESYNIRTGVYDDNIQANPSSWAMKLTAGTGTGIDPVTGESVPTTPPTIINGFDNYSTIPNVYTQVAKRTSGTSMTTDTSVSGSYLNTTYQIYANSAQPSGTYNGKVKYVMVHPSSNANNISTLEAAFAAAGKVKGYSDGTSSNLYYAMQDITTDICNSVTSYGEITATQLIDIRDNKLYWVAKLADGHCWMTQNLDLDLSHEVALTSETSDIDPNTYGNGIYTSATGYSQSGNIVSWTPSTIDSNNIQQADTKTMAWSSDTAATITDWTNNTNNPYSVDAGDRYMYTDASGNEAVYTSLEACEIGTNNDIAGCEHMHLGNYYNWSAAVASNNTASASGNQTNSICPKNWDLPTTGKYGTMLQSQSVWTGDANNTYDTDGYLKIRTDPLYFLQSGRVQNGTLSSFGTYSRYWSSMVNTTAYFISFDAYGVYPNGTNGNRGYGFSVRCVAR